MEDFRINNAFTVMPGKNMVNEVRLEPRLMKLLCLLAENPRQVISREKIIETIWQGYGGGDEGLTQAISFLRKLFNDHEKKIIETVPKAGYIFHADVEPAESSIQPRCPVGALTEGPFSVGKVHVNGRSKHCGAGRIERRHHRQRQCSDGTGHVSRHGRHAGVAARLLAGSEGDVDGFRHEPL